MARDLVFNVKNRPTLETPGETEVISRVYTDKSKTDYEDTAVGVVVKERGSDTTSAFLYDGLDPLVKIFVGDGFKTRSQAGHAVRAAHDEITKAVATKVADAADTNDGAADDGTGDEYLAGIAAGIGDAADEIAAEEEKAVDG